MKKLFRINNIELAEEIIEKSKITLHRNNEFLEVDNDMYNLTIMEIMGIISKNQKYEKVFSVWYDSLDKPHDMPDFLYGKPRAESWAIEGDSIEKGLITNFVISEIKKSWETLGPKLNNDNLGIESINSFYIETNELQDPKYEYKKITKFLDFYKEKYAQKNNMNKEDINIQFINYGKTELVFILKDQLNNHYTLLVKQPKVNLGEVLIKKVSSRLVYIGK